MQKRIELLKVATSQIGYAETPANSNKTKYGKWFGYDGAPWCGMFVSWVYDKAGCKLPRIGFTHGFAGVQTLCSHAIRNLKFANTPKLCDIVVFDFDGNGVFEHCGLYIGSVSDTEFLSIEGNTSDLNDKNGGSVMLRVRSFKHAKFYNYL